jgi:hypothetical protein
MKFRRDWPIIWRDLVIPILGISIFITCVLFIPLYKAGQLRLFIVDPGIVFYSA